MSDLAKLIISVVAVFSLVGSLMFYLTIMSGAVRIYNGDYNATQEMAQAVSDEVVSTMEWTIVKVVLIAFFSAIGIGSIVAILKKA